MIHVESRVNRCFSAVEDIERPCYKNEALWGPSDVCLYFDWSSEARCLLRQGTTPKFIFRHFHNV